MAFEFPLCTATQFRSSEVADVVGMQLDMLRLWRSRGHLPKKEGRGPVYSALEIAEIMVRHDLSNYGVPPAKSESIGKDSAAQIIRLAVLNHPQCCVVSGPRDQVESLKQMHSEGDVFAAHISNCEVSWDYLIRRDNEFPELVADISNAMDEGSFKIAMVINLHKCAELLVHSTGAALFRCTYPEVEGQELVHLMLGSP